MNVVQALTGRCRDSMNSQNDILRITFLMNFTFFEKLVYQVSLKLILVV